MKGCRVPSLEAVGNTTLAEIVRCHFHCDFIARQDTNPVLAHSARSVSDDLVIIFQLHAERRVRQKLNDGSRELQDFFLGHVVGSISL